jgi:hypothetical protein
MFDGVRACESGGGPPQSKTLRVREGDRNRASVVNSGGKRSATPASHARGNAASNHVRGEEGTGK